MATKSKKAPIKQLTRVTISLQTAKVALQALNKLVGRDGRSKVIIGQAEMELEGLLANTNDSQPETVEAKAS